VVKHLLYLYLVSVLDFHNESQGCQTEDDCVDNVQQVEALQLPTKVVTFSVENNSSGTASLEDFSVYTRDIYEDKGNPARLLAHVAGRWGQIK
jgi:hypothetical protein